MKIRKMVAGLLMACFLFQMPQMQALTYAAIETDGGTADIELKGQVLKNNLSLRVIVYDAKTRDVIPNAQVALQDESNYAKANRKGEVTLTGLMERQTYDIFVSYVGYESQKLTYLCQEDNAEMKVYLAWQKHEGGGGPSPNGGNGPSSKTGPGVETIEETSEAVPESSEAVSPEEAESQVPPAGDRQEQADTEETTAEDDKTGGRTDETGGIEPNPILPETDDAAWRQITDEEIEESIRSGSPLVIEPLEEGGEPFETDAFTEHDKKLLENNELWVKYTAGKGWSLILVNPESESEGLTLRQAKIPHSLMETAKEKKADIQVIFRDGSDEGIAAIFPAEFFEEEDTMNKDMVVEYDTETGGMSILFSVSGDHSSQETLMISANSFAFAGEKGFTLKASVYNPADEEDLWYEWTFTAENLKQGTPADTDLYVHHDGQNVGNADNILSSMARWRRVQLFTINHHGALPATASLRVKNLAGFPQNKTVSYVTYNTELEKSETLYRNIGFDEEGFAVIPHMDHCSSYALVGAIWWWWMAAGAAGVLIILSAVYLFTRQKRKRSAIMNEVWEASQGEDEQGNAGGSEFTDESNGGDSEEQR